MPAAGCRLVQRGRQLTFLALMVLVLLVLVCFPVSMTAQSGDDDQQRSSGGISQTLDSIPSQRRYADRQDVFAVDPGTPLQAELGFIQSFPETKQFRVFLLMNYQQANIGFRAVTSRVEGATELTASPIPFPTNGDMSHVMEFTAAPDKELWFQMWTEPLAPGFYDLALIIVPDPYENQRDLRYWTTFRSTTRASVYVGDEASPPTVDFPLIDPAARAGSDFNELLWFGQEPYTAGLSSGQLVEAGAAVTLTLNYQPNVENLADHLAPDTPLPTAFVAIIDDRVVPFNGQPVLYGSGVPGRLSWLPVTVQVPSTPGIHQLFLQQFPNPYVDEGSGGSRTRPDRRIQPTLRARGGMNQLPVRHPVTLFVRLSLAFVVVLATFAFALTAPVPAIASEQKKARVAADEGPVLNGAPSDFEIFSTRDSVSRKIKDRRGKDRRACNTELCAERRERVSNGVSTVFVEAQLAVDDRQVIEYVAGRAYGNTGTPSSRVRSMRVGGALIRHTTCRNIWEDGQQLDFGNTTVQYRHYAYWGWTSWYRGFNDCWVQTAHNYFTISMGSGKAAWKDFVTTDEIQDF